jgi:putative ABC transport system permease protein
MRSGLLMDMKMGLRQLRQAPSVSLAAFLTLAVGIGATTATVSLAAAVMSAARIVPDLDRRVGLWSHNRGEMEAKRAVSPADFIDWRQRATMVDAMVAMRDRTFNMSAVGLPVRVSGTEVTPDYLDFFRLSPRVGRSFTADDAKPGAAAVAILSDAFWRTQLGGRDDLVGQTVRLDGQSTTIVGLLPPSPAFTGIFIPLQLDRFAGDRAGRSLFVWARLAPGVEIGQARAEMESIGRALEREHPETNSGWTINTRPLEEEFVGPEARLALTLLVGMAITVLLIGCVNVANLLLARGAGRQGEIAVRVALGAAPWRIARQLLVEAGVLAVLGAAGSLFVSRWVLATLASLLPVESPWLASGITWRLLGVTCGGALLAAIAAGLLPALLGRRVSLTARLQSIGRFGAGHAGRLTRVLVAGQVSLAVVLLMVAGLLDRSLAAVRQLEAGFDPANLLTAQVVLPEGISEERVVRWFDEAVARAGSIPGVTHAAAASRLPFAGSRFNASRGLVIEGRAEPSIDAGTFAIDYVVTPGYFAAMRVPVREGREFEAADASLAPLVAVVSETLARRYWPDRSPLGARLRQGDDPEGVWRTVVGVVTDIRNDDADQPPLPYLYLPLSQRPQRSMSIVLRTAGDPAALGDTLRRELAAYDPDQPIFDVQTMAAIVEADLRQTVILIRLLNALAATALGLAALGIWGVVSQLLAERRREIGVRLALGASSARVCALVLRAGFLPVIAGLIVGLGAGFGVASLMRSILFEVTPADPATIAAAALLIVLAAAAALAGPLRRVLRLDPMEVLRID